MLFKQTEKCDILKKKKKKLRNNEIIVIWVNER